MSDRRSNPSSRLPFQGLSAHEWTNLALLAVSVYYVIKIAMEIYFQNVYMIFGSDFLSFWSAGWLANLRGYWAAYDLHQLAEIQYLYVPKPEDASHYQFYPVITFFLPVFLLPFQALAILPLDLAFIIWSLINFIGYLGYLIFFIRSFSLKLHWRQIVLCCLFYPFFRSNFFGQIGLILVIATGEFFRAFVHSRPYRAGFWLGLLMIKPQILILLPLILLIQRQWKIVFGFIITVALLGIISLSMITLGGIQSLLELSDELANGYPTVVPAGMLNWRMIGENLEAIGLPSLGWMVTWLGILLTLFFIASQFLRRTITVNNSPAAFLALFAATGLVSWHYHIHSAIVLIPFLLFLSAKDIIPDSWLIRWILLPGVILILTELVGLVSKVTGWEVYPSYPALLQGGCGLILSVWTTLVAAKRFRELSAMEKNSLDSSTKQ